MSNGELVLPCKQTQTAQFCRLMGEVSAVPTHSPRHPSPFARPHNSAPMYLFMLYFHNITAETLFLLSHKHLRSITKQWRSHSRRLITALFSFLCFCVLRKALMMDRIPQWACEDVIWWTPRRYVPTIKQMVWRWTQLWPCDLIIRSF